MMQLDKYQILSYFSHGKPPSFSVNITGALLANIEIECTDCHGRPTEYPWKFPLGRGDEFGLPLKVNTSSGVAAFPRDTHLHFNTN